MTADRLVLSCVLGRWATNCYVVADVAAGTAVVIDPGEGGASALPGLLDGLGLSAEALLVTHGHLDHLWSVPALAERLDVPVLLHDDDRWLWRNPAEAFGAPYSVLRDQFGLDWQPDDGRLEPVRDGQRLRFASTVFTVRHNPGHTPGHVTYLAHDLAGAAVALEVDPDRVAGQAADGRSPDAAGTAGVTVAARLGAGDRSALSGDEVLFSGDLVFAGSIGRTDLVGGSVDDMMRSLVRTVVPLDDDTLILSGHGPQTTVAAERAANAFLHEAIARQG